MLAARSRRLHRSTGKPRRFGGIVPDEGGGLASWAERALIGTSAGLRKKSEAADRAARPVTRRGRLRHQRPGSDARPGQERPADRRTGHRYPLREAKRHRRPDR
jgi:hypothetical protein